MAEKIDRRMKKGGGGGGGGEMDSSKNSILSYLVNAFMEWLLILMLLFNSMFTYFIFRFAHRFRLKKPCLCCSSSAFMSPTTDLFCHHHAAAFISNELMSQPILLHNCISKQNLIATSIAQNARYAAEASAADDDSLDEKTILERTGADFLLTADNIKSTRLIRDLYSNENVVEFDFLEDEYDQKDIVHDDDGYRIVGRDGFTWRRSALSEAEPLMIDGWLGHDHEPAAAASAFAMQESMLESQEDTLLMIKHKKVNEDESYSIAYTAEGDLVMDLCRNLASVKSVSTAYDNVDDIPQVEATAEQQADELSHQAHGEILALKNIENAERRIELDEENQQPEKSNDILTQSCLQYRTIEHEKTYQVARSVCPSPPFRTEELVCEQVQGISVPASVDNSLEHSYERNGEDVPYALPNSPLPVNREEISEMQEKSYREQAPAPPFPLSAADRLGFCQIDNQGPDLEDKTKSHSVLATQHPLAFSLGLIKNEEDKLPDTPSSFNGTHSHYNNWLLFEKRESATEEIFDGSINSDFECGEGILTVDKLKTALQVERKALHALYAELEEERNASAVAASQTMAMINRLQEEKASVQMEALQYQRMMEEQSEYDQEALQLLNDLMIKREREIKDLEKELEIYRRRVIDYETKERLMMLNRKDESLRSGRSSVSCSNAEDSDEVSIDLKVDMKDMNGFHGKEENGIDNTPCDEVLHMEELFSNFEEERLSILEQFKALEEKIFSLDNENDGIAFNHDYSCITNGTENGYHDDVNGNYHRDRKTIGPKAKMLLPLFDETIDGNENTELSMNENGHDLTSYPHSSAPVYETESIEEEIDHVYERLRSLEADNEFLRHCFSSLNRGHKGLELLQEILLHLRNLRTIKLEVRK